MVCHQTTQSESNGGVPVEIRAFLDQAEHTLQIFWNAPVTSSDWSTGKVMMSSNNPRVRLVAFFLMTHALVQEEDVIRMTAVRKFVNLMSHSCALLSSTLPFKPYRVVYQMKKWL